MGCTLCPQNSSRVEPGIQKFDDGIVLLLLGIGNSGKSTIMKQMKILHKNGFTQSERKHYIALIVGNLSQSMYAIIDLIQTEREFTYKNEETEKLADNFMTMIHQLFRGNFELNLDIIPCIRMLLQEPAIITCFAANRSRIINSEAVEYFFEQIDRICLPGFLPNNEDILHTRLPTSGVHEIKFNYETREMTMIDVGGQRVERSKWLHCFEGVTSFIYCVSLVEYASQMHEDASINAMYESLNVFSKVINNLWFKKKSCLLFLNKIDLLQGVIEKVPLKKVFVEYQGNLSSATDAITFVTQMYLSRDMNPNRTIYTHVTCATDTNNIKATFCMATRSIIERNLDVLGLV